MASLIRDERLAVLDGLRGISAPAVALFTHFQHFGGDPTNYPFNNRSVPHFFYLYSQFFVDLFFVLSGMIMTHRYLQPLGEGRVSGRDFFFLRLSRLYPIHLFGLLVCATVEWWLGFHQQPFVIYTCNDLYHFALHLTLTHLWFERGPAYNYPAWSICAEVFVYFLFYFAAAKRPKAFPLVSVLIVGVGVAMLSDHPLPLLNRNMARALVGFFMGSLVFLGLQQVDRAGHAAALGYGCLAFLGVIGLVSWGMGFNAFVGRDPLPYGLMLFPLLTTVCLTVRPIAVALSVRPLTFLGEISYALYLVHVPLQMITLAVANAHNWSLPTASAWFFFLYLVTILSLGTIAHYALERPARRWIRARFLTNARRAVVEAPAPAAVRAPFVL